MRAVRRRAAEEHMSYGQRFEDRAALVTGGASGIGRAVGVRLASEGADVTVADINEENGRETCREIEAARGRDA